MSGNMLPISIAPMGQIAQVVSEEQMLPELQQMASQHIALETLRNENKQVQKTDKGNKSIKVGEKPAEERKKNRHRHIADFQKQTVFESKQDKSDKPLSGHLLNVKI